MTTIKPPAAQAGSYRVGDLDLNRIGYVAAHPCLAAAAAGSQNHRNRMAGSFGRIRSAS
jgi:hypothetical protein